MTALKPAAGLVIAHKYLLLERVGVGGMSEVYRAENTLIGRTVALKLLHPDRAGDLGLTTRFFQEAQSVSRIRHPAIVDVFDAGQGETGPFIVMEFLEGESAARVLARQGRLDVQAAVATLLPVLAALQAAHDAGVVHRDLKPENVFLALDDSGNVSVKLLDFGVAKMLWPSGAAPRTSTGIVFGTPDYLSPEQAAGEVEIDGRSDVFSAGVLLFELLTNVRPFHAPTAIATAYKVANAETPRLQDHGGPANPRLQAIVSRAMQKRPTERYRSAREFAHELATLADAPERLSQALQHVVLPRRASGVRSTVSAVTSADPAKRQSAPRLVLPASGAQSRDEGKRSPSSPTSSSRLRSLPARFVGQCHARGLVLRAVDAYLSQNLGEARRLAVLRELDSEVCRELEQGVIQGIVYYDLSEVTAYLDQATRRLFDGNPGWCRNAGEAAVDGELSALLRTALRPDLPLMVVRRVVPLYSRLFDFGLWDVQPDGPRRLSVRITDFEAASLPLRLWLAGALQGALRVCESRPHLTIARGDAGFAPQLVFDISTL
jgi:serine/threonine protein kinase